MRDRALALLSAFFSIAAIVLVAVGLYGVHQLLRRAANLRDRDSPGRSDGTEPLRVMVVVFAEVAAVGAAIGLVIGVAGGMAAARFITALLYEAKPSDA